MPVEIASAMCGWTAEMRPIGIDHRISPYMM